MEKVGIVDKIQEKMCDMVYAKLRELMVSVERKNVIIQFNPKIKTEFKTSSDGMFFYHNDSYIGEFKQSEKQDLFFDKIVQNIEFESNRVETYKKWIEAVESKIIELSQEEQEYQKLLDKIIDMPILTKEREVLFEKKK